MSEKQKDYGDAEDWMEILCNECGEYLGYSQENQDFKTFLCTDCMEKIFPE